MDLKILGKNNNNNNNNNNLNNLNNLNDKIIYDFIVIILIIIISILLLFDYLMTIIELKDEIKNIKKYIESLTNIENYNYKDTKTKISLIMDNILYFQEEQYKNIMYIEEMQKELKAKEEHIKIIEHKLDESIKNNKQLAINIYYYWKTSHNINPGLIPMYDIIDGIYKHFYDTTFNPKNNNFSYEILEKTIPFLIKKKQKELLDNTIFR